eukprot:3219289-Lingulodinium_polyedra.AAC.1
MGATRGQHGGNTGPTWGQRGGNMEETWKQHGGHVAMCRYLKHRLRAAETCIRVYPTPVGS